MTARRTPGRRVTTVLCGLLVVVAAILATAAPAAAATVPGAPTGLTVTTGNYGLAELNWTTPTSDGGSPLTGYTVLEPHGANCSLGFPAKAYAQCVVSYGVTYTFTVTAENALGSSLPSNAVTVTPTPMLSVGNATATEGNSAGAQLSFPVSLDGTSAQAVTVFYATGDGTARAPADYQPRRGTLTFAPGQTLQTVVVPIVADSIFESTEKMAFSLYLPTNASFRRRVATGRILDDDTPPSLSIADMSHVERSRLPGATLRFTVTLSVASGATTKVRWATVDGTAHAGSDYAANEGTLTIRAGSRTGVVAVLVAPDTLKEPNETFSVMLSGSSGATIARAVAVGTILDDD